MPPVVRDLLALCASFALALAVRTVFPWVWPFDFVAGDPVFSPMDPRSTAWMFAVLAPVWTATWLALGLWSDDDPAPALPAWLLAGPVALMLSLAGFELLRVEPVSRSLVLGHALGTTALLGVLHGPAPDRPVSDRTKRVLDVCLGGVLLLLAAPAIGALAAWIRHHDGGPALFVQDRVGRDGQPIQVIKLRTMELDAEARQPSLAPFNHVRGPAFRMADDPRVTGPGRWLRPTGLDELPQLINVLRGEMSLVGPRPPLPAEVAHYTDHQRRRLTVLPGMTGLWQLTGRDLPDFDQWVAVDLAYIERRSLALDLWLLARTVPWLLAQLLRPTAHRTTGSRPTDRT